MDITTGAYQHALLVVDLWRTAIQSSDNRSQAQRKRGTERDTDDLSSAEWVAELRTHFEKELDPGRLATTILSEHRRRRPGAKQFDPDQVPAACLPLFTSLLDSRAMRKKVLLTLDLKGEDKAVFSDYSRDCCGSMTGDNSQRELRAFQDALGPFLEMDFETFRTMLKKHGVVRFIAKAMNELLGRLPEECLTVDNQTLDQRNAHGRDVCEPEAAMRYTEKLRKWRMSLARYLTEFLNGNLKPKDGEPRVWHRLVLDVLRSGDTPEATRNAIRELQNIRGTTGTADKFYRMVREFKQYAKGRAESER